MELLSTDKLYFYEQGKLWFNVADAQAHLSVAARPCSKYRNFMLARNCIVVILSIVIVILCCKNSHLLLLCWI